jgi:spore coat protein U-like protein
MTKFVRLAALAAAATIAATPAYAVPVTGQAPTATARITKPLELTRIDDLDFGSVAVTGSDTITIDHDDGSRDCGDPANLSCSGTWKRAEFKVTGSNNQDVTIVTPDVTLAHINPAITDTLDLRLTSLGTVNLTSSGSNGTTFYVGGEVDIDEDAAEGTYVGTLAVTVNY